MKHEEVAFKAEVGVVTHNDDAYLWVKEQHYLHARVTRVTGKGEAFIWIYQRVKPEWLRNILMDMTRFIPEWVFQFLGFRGWSVDFAGNRERGHSLFQQALKRRSR